MNHPVMMVQTI